MMRQVSRAARRRDTGRDDAVPCGAAGSAGRRLLRRALGAAATAALVASFAAGPAAADSLVYVNGGDVWVARPDGSAQTRLTSEGVYGEASQADDGTIVATAGVHRLRRLDRGGRVLADFPAAALADENWAGPFDPDVSPDGTKVAYSWLYESRGSSSPGCPLTPDECTLGYIRGGTTVSWADRATGLGELGWWRHWTQPSWIGSDRLLLGGRDLSPVFDRAGIASLGGQGDGVAPWFGAGSHLADGDMSRSGDRVAYVTGIRLDTLAVWQVDGPPGDRQPTFCFSFTGPSGHFADPSWSPDGRSLAWSEDDGIWVATIPGCGEAGVESRMVVPLADLPDWGPADVPTVQQPPDRRPGEEPPPQRREQTRTPVRRTPMRRCVVPKVKAGAALAATKRALVRGGCRARTKRVRSAKVRRGRVVRLSAKAGRRLAWHATVTVEVSRGRR
jgi:hypothetical protein